MKAGGSKSVATQSTLIVRPQKEDDGAEYRCVAWNRAMDTNDKKEANIVLAINCKFNPSLFLILYFPAEAKTGNVVLYSQSTNNQLEFISIQTLPGSVSAPAR
jgi:hypothetical protein